MHKMLIATASAVALMTGAALAETGSKANPAASSDQSQMQTQAQSSPTSRPVDMPANASLDQLMNRTVIGADGERLGKVSDVIIGPDGQAKLLVVQSGGFLGIGGKDVAVDIALTQIQPGEDTIKVRDVTQATVRDMPEFQYDDTMTSLGRGPRNNQGQQEQNKQ